MSPGRERRPRVDRTCHVVHTLAESARSAARELLSAAPLKRGTRQRFSEFGICFFRFVSSEFCSQRSKRLPPLRVVRGGSRRTHRGGDVGRKGRGGFIGCPWLAAVGAWVSLNVTVC